MRRLALLLALAALASADAAPRPFHGPRKALPAPRTADPPMWFPPGDCGVWLIAWCGQRQEWEYRDDGTLWHGGVRGEWRADATGLYGTWSGYYFHLGDDGAGAWRGWEHNPSRGPVRRFPVVAVFLRRLR